MRFLGLVLLALLPLQAYAYVDPGTGAYIVQALIALVAAASFYVRHPIKAIKALWKRLTRRK